MKLSIVVPAYNEEYRIGPMLDAYLPFFYARYGVEFELIVVVNGSTDGTAGLVRNYAQQWTQLRLIEESDPIGKGGAVMLGLNEAAGDCAGYVDADGSTPPSAFLELVNRVGPAARAVIASRWIAGAVVSPPQPFIRRLASRVFNTVTRILFGLKLHDTQCGAKVFDRCLLNRLLDRPGIITRWAFDVDLLYQIRREGVSILELPTTWKDVEGSKLKVTETSLEMLAALVRMRLVYSPLRWIVAFYDRYLIGSVATEENLRQSLLFGVGGVVTNGFNLAFQVLAAHLLLRGGGVLIYGEMAAILCAAAFVSNVFSGAARHLLLHGGKGAEGVPERMRRVLPRTCLQLLLLLFLLLLPVALFAEHIAAVLRMDNRWPVWLAVALAVAQTVYALLNAALTGMQSGRSVAVLNMFHSVLRFSAAALLLSVGYGLAGALAAALVASVAALGAAMILTAKMLPPRAEAPVLKISEKTAGFGGYVLPLAAFALLSGGDVLLVKWRCLPVDAAHYALASMIAKLVFFLPMPVAATAFSKAAEAAGMPSAASRIQAVKVALPTILLSILLPVAVISLSAHGLVRIMTSADPAVIVPLLLGLAIANVPLPLLSLLLNYSLARQHIAAASLIPVAACTIFVLPLIQGASIPPGSVVVSLGLANAVCLGVLLVYAYRRLKATPAVRRD